MLITMAENITDDDYRNPGDYKLVIQTLTLAEQMFCNVKLFLSFDFMLTFVQGDCDTDEQCAGNLFK